VLTDRDFSLFQISWIIFSTLSGGIYFQEFVEYGANEIAAFGAGFVLLLVGVALLCPRKKATQAESPAEVIYNFMAPPPVARTLIMTMDEFDESDEVPFLPTT